MQEIFFSQRTTLPTRTPDVLDRNYALLQQAEGYVYKTVDGIDLGAYIFRPGGTEPPPGGWPVALFFCSSTWDNGLVSQFAPHAMYLASRGMAGILIDYRVTARFPGCTPMQAAADARSAVRWTREHAVDLGIDPLKVAGCGGSAGAHAILSAALSSETEDEGEDASIPCAPNALVLYSPILDTGPKGIFIDRFPDKKSAFRTSPMRGVRRKLPPMLIIHGTTDRVVPFEQSVRFKKKNWWRRNVCHLLPYASQGHGFFNFNFDVRLYELTLNDLDRFFVERGFLPPNPDDDGVPRLS
jgi:acetyl esterase/lipase